LSYIGATEYSSSKSEKKKIREKERDLESDREEGEGNREGRRLPFLFRFSVGERIRAEESVQKKGNLQTAPESASGVRGQNPAAVKARKKASRRLFYRTRRRRRPAGTPLRHMWQTYGFYKKKKSRARLQHAVLLHVHELLVGEEEAVGHQDRAADL
jgi:hypothetical protein